MKKFGAINSFMVLWLLTGFLWLGSSSPVQADDHDDQAGVVVSLIETSGYIYIEYLSKNEKKWAACPKMEIKVGDKISFEGGYLMVNYYSKTLKRTFDTVFFVGEVEIIK